MHIKYEQSMNVYEKRYLTEYSDEYLQKQPLETA